MVRRHLWVRGAVTGLLIALLASAGQAALEYTFVDLGTGPPGFTVAAVLGASGGQLVGDGRGPSTGGNFHALLWTSAGAPPVDLHPAGFAASVALGAWGDRQVGYAETSVGYPHALLWSGTPGSRVDLNPSGYTYSVAEVVYGARQVGSGYWAATSQTHALLWSGSATQFIDLNPDGSSSSAATGLDANHQIGLVTGPLTGGAMHAALWSGTPGSWVDLHPSWLARSAAQGIGGGQIVGSGAATGGGSAWHAILWADAASQPVDLNPSGFDVSYAIDTNGSSQVGYGEAAASGYNERALVWSGTAESAVDLHAFVPPAYQLSKACAIDESGNVFGWVMTADGKVGHAAEWVLVPEPLTAALLLVAGLSAGAKGRVPALCCAKDSTGGCISGGYKHG
jgi:hypothetical protein